MDLYAYLQSGKIPSTKKKGKKRKRGKVKWGNRQPKGIKDYTTKPVAAIDKLLTTMTASLLQNPADKIRQSNLAQDYGNLNIGERLDERLYYAGLARPTKQQILKNDNLKQSAREGRARYRAFQEGKLDQFDTFIADTRADNDKQNVIMRKFLKENPPQQFQYDEIEEIKLGPVKEAGKYLPFSDTTEDNIPDEFISSVSSDMSFAFSDSDYNLDNQAEQYKQKSLGIQRELDDLLDTLNTGGGIETMRKEAIQDLKKKRNDIFVEALQQEEFMLEGLTDDNKDYRDKFVNTFKKDIYNLDFWSKDIMEIDRLLDIEQKLTFDFNVNDTMNLSPQEAQQELNLVEQEINQLSAPTQSYDQLLEQLNFS
tara:strand:+ start:3949 stop:5052 length:1104 start_codon:yes stop_codon:yes gene_type:complete